MTTLKFGESFVPVQTIPRLNIPRPVINRVPPPVIRNSPPPVVRGLEIPIIDVPTPIIEYPTLDVPTREQFEGAVTPPAPPPTTDKPERSRLLPETVPILGRDIPIPDAATLITTGSTAAIAVATTMGTTLLLREVLKRLDPIMKKVTESADKKNKKKKKGKTVLHFMQGPEGVIVMEYSNKGAKLLEVVDNTEHYLRDKTNENTMYELDNKIVIDSEIKESMTKEGQKRFSKLFCPSKSIVKKLSAKFSV